MFPLPKKILQKIETVCRKFLWTGAAEEKNKALVAWDQLCWPRTAGVLNITDVHTWNKAAVVKQLWNLSKKKDKLWIMWVHTYYIKGRAAWDVTTKQASWLIQKILQAAKYLTEANLDKVTILQADNYSIRDVYNQLRGDYPKVEWRRLICNNQGSPKWIFMLYLAIHCRMYTRDRLDKWGIQTSLLCLLCEVEKEDHQHIFFVCNYSRLVWEKLLTWQGIHRGVMNWKEEVKWASRRAKGKAAPAIIYRMVLAGAVYHLWLKRNQRIFQQKGRTPEQLVRKIIQDVHGRGAASPKLASILQALNFCP